MRLLEAHNPDVDFDWARLLKETLPDQGPRRDRDSDRRDRDRRDPRPPHRPRPFDTTSAAAVPPAAPQALRDSAAEIAEERAAAHVEAMWNDHGGQTNGSSDANATVDRESLAVTHGEPLAADHAEYEEFAAAARTARTDPSSLIADPESRIPDPPSPIPDPRSPAAARLGGEGVSRLRARYAQLVARLAEKPMEDEMREELNAKVERLNPDAWLTADEVAAALEQYEAVFESLRAHVGNQPRRRL